MGTQIRLGLVFTFISILCYVSSSYRYPKSYQFLWEGWGKEERVLHFHGHLCSIWIHWNKTRPFMCLEDVTEHLPLNLRHSLSMSILSPHSGYLQGLFYLFEVSNSDHVPGSLYPFSSLRIKGNAPVFYAELFIYCIGCLHPL